MNPSSPPDAQHSEAQDPRPATSAELEERLRRSREERVRKSLAALDRDRPFLTRASGAQTLSRVVMVVVALLALWAIWVRLSS